MTDNYKIVPKFVFENFEIVRMTFFTSTDDFVFEKPTTELLDRIPNEINKFVFIFDDEKTTLEVKKILLQKFDTYSFDRSWNTGLEMHAKNSGKGICLKEIKKKTSAKYVIAAGDYENDETMLKEADISYAPENAIASIKDAADYVTVHCKEHAIAHIIKELEEKGAEE